MLYLTYTAVQISNKNQGFRKLHQHLSDIINFTSAHHGLHVYVFW